MIAWSPQHYIDVGNDRGIDAAVLNNAVDYGKAIISANSKLPVIFSLGHLAYLTDTNYGFLRQVVSRSNLATHYRTFRIRKRSSRAGSPSYRIISVPDPRLMYVQRWIASRILTSVDAHQASTAFARKCNIVDAASRHCKARWLIKLDVRDFFHSISERPVYSTFIKLGYQPLVAFELSRLCTRQVDSSSASEKKRWQSRGWRYKTIKSYATNTVGHLPQGAPTSPMLSNLVARDFDEAVYRVASEHGVRYSRYADDIILSAHSPEFNYPDAKSLLRSVQALLVQHGFFPNRAKTTIVGPGCRRVVLGLLVDGERPRLTKKFRASLRMHLHFLLHKEVGPVKHANARGFDAVGGLRNHIEGLLAFAGQVEPEFAMKLKAEFNQVEWPI